MSIAIPEGYELLAGRNRKNAKKALGEAVDRGFPEQTVLTHPEGYLIPTGETADGTAKMEEADEAGEAEAIEQPKPTASKAEQEAFAEEHGIDLSGATNAETRAAAIQAWAEAQPEAQAEAADDQKEN